MKKAVKAWALVFAGKILPMTYETRSEARMCAKPHCKVIRVEIREVSNVKP